MSHRAVWKYVLPFEEPHAILMQGNAEPIHFAVQDGHPCFWAVVRSGPLEPLEERRFFIAGTGAMLPEDPSTHIGTTIEGAYVWHLFELDREVKF